MKKVLVVMMTLIMSLSLFTGCGSDSGTSSRAEENKMILGIESELTSLDVANGDYSLDFVIRRCLYEPLVHVDPVTGEEEMRLAESYEVKDGGLVYTFKLKPDVKMHDGSTLTAKDVVYSLNMTKESLEMGKNLSAMKEAKVIDDLTVELVLDTPYAAFMKNISMCFILSASAHESLGADGFNEAPVGCGPYQFVSYENESKLTFVAFPDYYRGAASIENIEIRMFADANSLAIAMESGELDAAAAINPVDYDNVTSNENIVVNEVATTKYCVATMNTTIAPFDNQKVRQAVNYAIDREFVLNASRDGKGKATSILFNTVLPCTEGIEEYTYDPDKAKTLLEEAGLELPVTLDATIQTYESCKTEAEAVQQNLADIGINMEIEILEPGALYGGLASGDAAFAVVRNGTSAIDADQYYMNVSKNGFDSLNYAVYENEDVEKLMVEARSEMDAEKRDGLYNEALQILQKEVPYAIIYEMPDLHASVSELNVNWGLNGMYYLYDFSWK